MRAGLLAWNELHLYFANSKDIQGGQQLLFSSEYLVHCSLVFPQIKNTFEDFLTKLTCLRLFRPMLHSNVSGQVVFPHWLRAMRTAGHHPSYKLLQSGIAQSSHENSSHMTNVLLNRLNKVPKVVIKIVAIWQMSYWTDLIKLIQPFCVKTFYPILAAQPLNLLPQCC